MDPTIDPSDVTIMDTGDPLTVTFPEAQEGYTATGDANATEGSAYSFTVTPKKGWNITAVTYSVVGGDSNQSLTGDGTTYTIPAEKVTGAITISVTAARITHSLTVTVDTPANVKTLTYSVVNGTADQTLTSGTAVSVNEGDSLTLKVEPVDGYGVEVKKGETSLTGTDNVYTVGEVTGDVEIAVSTFKNSYTVTEDITNKAADDLAVIEYQNNCVSGDTTKKIAKGTDLKFKVKAADNADLTGKKVVVSYKVGATGEATPLTAVNDTYTVEAAKITDDITITVTVRALTDYTVTLDTNPNITAQYATGAAPAADDWKTMEATATVKEDDTFNFKPTANKYFNITEVKAGEEVLKATAGVYTFTVTENVTITVKTELDAKQCNTLTFTVDGDKDSAEAIFSVSANDVGNLNGTKVESGKAISVPNDKVSLKVKQSDGYKITKINGNNVTPNQEGEVDYEVTFTNKKATVKVTTDALESVIENIITFNNKARNLTYKVVENSTVEKISTDKYTAKLGATKLQFSITATGSYEPIVTRTPEKAEDAEEEPSPIALNPVKTTTTKTGATYDYVVAASLLSNDTITIEQQEIQKTVILSGDTANVVVSASVDGKTRKPDNENANQYTLLQNDTIALRIAAKANVGLVKVTSKVGEAGKVTTAKVANGVSTLEVKATDDVTITIETEDQYTASKLKKDGIELPVADAKKNAYNVSYDGTYTANVVKGVNSEPVTLSEVKVLIGKNPVVATEGKGAVGSVTDGTTATINLGNAATSTISGKALTVELYTKEGTGDEAKDVNVGSYTLNVDALVKDIKIDKKPALSVKQAIDTEKTYTVTAAKGVDLSRLVATKEDADSIIDGTVGFDTATGKLTVKVKADKALIGKKATVTIAETGAAADSAKATIEIEASALISDATKEPGVKLVAATDLSFKLALSSDKKIENAASEKIYYKINTVETKDGSDVAGTAKVTYVPRDGDSQNALVIVAGDTISGNSLQPGDGKAGSYKVTATLVHTKDAPTADVEVAETNLLGASKTSKEQVMKTQTPAYEDKLKLKKGVSTIATGQQDVIIATPQFNKYTTYLALKNGDDAAEDVTFDGDQALEVEVDDIDGEEIVIKASATADTALGKHTIQVTAAAEDGAYPSTATVVVTVVRGIHGLEVTVPSVDIYKPVKKAATLKATVVYNDDTSGKNKDSQPKNKKVLWSAVAVDADGEVKTDNNDHVVAFDGVTVKNGTVTVNKDYIINGDEAAPEKDQFRIMVTADNTEKSFAGMEDDGSAVVGYSPVITITNQGADLNTIVLVGADNKVIAQSVRGSKDELPVTASELNGAEVKVLPAGVTVTANDGTYAANGVDEINIANLSYKSSKAKDVVVENNGSNVTLAVTKANTKTTLTVTANDGSKAKIDMKLNVGYDTVEAAQTLGLQFYPLNVAKDGNVYGESFGSALAAEDTKAITYTGTTRLAAKVMVKTGEAWSPAPGFANYEIKVTGGTKPELSAGMAKFTAQKKAVTVTLTDKSKAKDQQTPVSYTLTNSDIDETTKEKVTAKTAGNLHKEGKSSEQKVTINLEMPKALGEKLADKKTAVVDLDWTKMNAKNSADLYYFKDSLKETAYEITNLALDSKGTKYTASFDLTFNDNDDMYFGQNSYALKVTVGSTTTGESGDTFTPLAAPAATTVKVDKTKAFTFTPTTSYTLLKKDMKASATLTGKVNVDVNEYQVDYSGTGLGLQNMNTKGVTNEFTKYFEISNGEIKWKGNAGVPAAKDMTGYLTYRAVPTVSYYSRGKGAGINTVKITVKFDDKKTAAKYSQSASGNLPVIGNVKDQKTTVNILAKVGKDPAEWAALSYAAVKSNDNVSKNFEAAVTGSDGGIELTYKGEEALKLNSTLSIKLFIVPTSSYYTDEIAAKNSNKEEQNKLIEAYGIAVTVKVKVTEVKSPADTAKAALEAWLTKVNTDQPTWLKNDLDTAAKLIAKINDTEVGANLGEGVTVVVAKKTVDNAEQDDYTLSKATVAAAGSITGNLTVTVSGVDPVTVALSLAVPAGAVTKDEAKTAVQDAETVKSYEVTNAKISAEGKEAASNEICALAQEVLGEKYYTVSVKTQLAGTDATAGNAGNATITLTIKEVDNDTDTGVDTDAISYTIAALPTE